MANKKSERIIFDRPLSGGFTRISFDGIVPTKSDYLNLGDVARNHMRQQCQYACHYAEGLFGKPNLGKGLRFRGNTDNYHEMEIHRDDAPEFVARYFTYLAAESGMSLDRYLNFHDLKLPFPSDFRKL